MGVGAAQQEFLVDIKCSKIGSTWVFQAAQHCGREETANENGIAEKENHSLWQFFFFRNLGRHLLGNTFFLKMTSMSFGQFLNHKGLCMFVRY